MLARHSPHVYDQITTENLAGVSEPQISQFYKEIP